VRLSALSRAAAAGESADFEFRKTGAADLDEAVVGFAELALPDRVLSTGQPSATR